MQMIIRTGYWDVLVVEIGIYSDLTL